MGQLDSKIAGSVLSLPANQRAELAELLLVSLDKPDASVDQLWVEEAEDRIDAYESGEMKAVSFDSVISKYK